MVTDTREEEGNNQGLKACQAAAPILDEMVASLLRRRNL
jgi:hypothetical protein